MNILTIILFSVALSLSATAAFFAVAGLVKIFAASAMSIAIMGSLLEAGKLVIASYLYQKWETTNIVMKSYFMIALFVLIGLTSMGVYGFLANAHSGQEVAFDKNSIQIERLDNQIEREKDTIKDAETVLGQLDNAVQILQDNDRIRGAQGSIAVRESQKEEREVYRGIIDEATKVIDSLEDKKLELETEQSTATAKLGPIKYIAELFGIQDPKSAFTIVSLAIVFVFDPIAILLLIAANKELKNSPNSVPKNPVRININSVLPNVRKIKKDLTTKISKKASELGTGHMIKDSDIVESLKDDVINFEPDGNKENPPIWIDVVEDEELQNNIYREIPEMALTPSVEDQIPEMALRKVETEILEDPNIIEKKKAKDTEDEIPDMGKVSNSSDRQYLKNRRTSEIPDRALSNDEKEKEEKPPVPNTPEGVDKQKKLTTYGPRKV